MDAAAQRRSLYSAVQINVVKGCVSAVLVHATFDNVYLDSRIGTTSRRAKALAAAFSVVCIFFSVLGKAKDDFSPLHSRSLTFVGLVSGRGGSLHNHPAVYFHWDGMGYRVAF